MDFKEFEDYFLNNFPKLYEVAESTEASRVVDGNDAQAYLNFSLALLRCYHEWLNQEK